MTHVTLIGVATIIVLCCAALGTMAGVLCDHTQHHRWALTVTLTVTLTLTITTITVLALWWQ